MASPNMRAASKDGHATRSSVKRSAEDGVIDVDAVPAMVQVPSIKAKGKAVAKVARTDEPINVDDPDSWVMPVPSPVGGPSGKGRTQPLMRFGGPLGVAVYEQKMEVLAEEAGTKACGGASSVGVASTAGGPASVAARTAVAARAEMTMSTDVAVPADVATPVDVTMPADVAVPADVSKPVVAAAPVDAVAPAAVVASDNVAALTVGQVEGVGAFAYPSQSRSDRVRASLLRRRPRKFVRRAAVMAVPRAPRMVAGPPILERAGSGSDDGASFGNDVSEDELDDGAAVDPDFVNDGNVATEAASEANGAPSTAGAGAAQSAADTGAMAERLADHTRNPRIFTASCWLSNAQAVMAAAQVPRAGLPPIAPPGAFRAAPLSVGMPPLSTANAPPPSSFPGSETPTDDATGDSSDMDDDALVTAYITPPVSPLPASTAASPRRIRPSSGMRRRAIDARTMRAAAAGAASAGADHELPSSALRDIHDAVRNGFSSVRRELTRLRAELVVVKSQSASTLRRVDGIAAAADGRESGSGVVLERIAVLDRAVHGLGERMSATGSGTAGTEGDGASGNSAGMVAEIKVRTCPPCGACFHMSLPSTLSSC